MTWFQIANGYNNPLNLCSVDSELFLLEKVKINISIYFNNRDIFFLGVGTGDTESYIVDVSLHKNKKVNVIGIDYNHIFLNLFDNSLNMRCIEKDFDKINYIKVNDYFENSFNNEIVQNYINNPKVICILGSTIGNFNDTNDILKIIDKLMLKGDILLVSHQTNKHIDIIFQRYKNNKLFIDLIGNYLSDEEKSSIVWKLNDNIIEAWLNDIQLFRTKKLSTNELLKLTNNFNFNILENFCDNYENLCISIFEKK